MLRFFALLSAVPIVLLAADTLAAPPPDLAIIVSGAGRIRTEHASDWSPTHVGETIPAGAIVEASGEAPIEVRFPDDVALTMEPGATALWHSRGRLPTEHNGWYIGFHIEQRAGEIDVRIPTSAKKGERAFLVSSKAGTLTDWRGSLHVTVAGETTAAAIYEGALVVGSNGVGFPVFDATAVLIRKGTAPEKSHGIPPAPTWPATTPPGTTPPLALIPEGREATVGFAWTPVAGASSYRVEVATDPVMVETIERQTVEGTSYTVKRPSMGGRYYVRVRAVSTDGIVGAWSKPRALRVVKYVLPPGASVAPDGAVVLSDQATVRLVDPSGLDVAFQSAPAGAPPPRVVLQWVPAPNSIALSSIGTRYAHIRDPSLGVETTLVLARRELAADIAMCPKRPTWPSDSIIIRVVAHDPSHRVDPAGEMLTMDTTVNLSPTLLSWHHLGAEWWARLDSQPVAGDIVVRVTVRDSGGHVLGEAHLDVDHEKATAEPAKDGVTVVEITR
jgi:hypothetical protein